MKAKLKRASIFLLLVCMGLGLLYYFSVKPRNPERLLCKVLKDSFGINSEILDPSITLFEEEWCLNGDGRLILKFDYAASYSAVKPILGKMELLPGSEFNLQFIKSEYSPTGFYLYKEVDGGHSFEVFILDTLNNKGLYYVNLK